MATISEEAHTYLATALSLVREHAYYSSRINWDAERDAALSAAHAAQTPAATYPAINQVLNRLGDRHSMLVPPDLARQLSAERRTGVLLPRGERLDGGVGYILLPETAASDEAATRYASSAHDLIRVNDKPPASGWIVDLRENTGGNMWPMLAAIGPILGEGQAGEFVYANGARTPWGYDRGTAHLDGIALASVAHPPYVCGPTARGGPRSGLVAVLTGRLTVSSGEAIAIAFRGRPHTRSFGAPTFGLPTGNEAYPLSDGALLVITEVVEADRTGRIYDGPIIPDQIVNEDADTGDPVREAAVAWLRAQPRGAPG